MLEMKKIRRILILSLLLFFMTESFQVKAEDNMPTRWINVVYDDSGSMINGGKDTWCQAKYSMEVFAGMLGEQDTMNIYVMSRYDGDPILTLKGTDGRKKCVSQIHDMMTDKGNTPFSTVERAYADLEKVSADEKWLVVLTDGAFSGVGSINNYFAGKSPDVKVMFLSMGAEGASINNVPEQDIYFVKAENGKEILNKITGICNRIFKTNKLEVSKTTKTFSFDVPMNELIVFAQGENVNIQGINSESGKRYECFEEPVEVKYSDIGTGNNMYANYDPSLVGRIAVFKDDFDAGKYTLEIEGAETIEIYYKTNVEIKAYLKDSNGNEIKNVQEIKEGVYTIEFGFVKTGTEQRVEQSKLLGDVVYSAQVTNVGKTHDKTYTSGDEITLKEGDLHISAMANYLDYYNVYTEIQYSIYGDKTIAYTVQEPVAEYFVVDEGISNGTLPTIVKATLNGNDMTEEEWEAFEVPDVEITLGPEQEFGIGAVKVEKTDVVGLLNLYPIIEGEPTSGTYSDFKVIVSDDFQYEDQRWMGQSQIEIKMTDQRNWFLQNQKLVKKIIILLLLIILILGYVPPFKKYIPKQVKRMPAVQRYQKRLGSGWKKDGEPQFGLVRRSLVFTILPYIPQRALITYAPMDIMSRTDDMKVKAVGGGRMAILNWEEFAEDENMKAGSESVVIKTDDDFVLESTLLATASSIESVMGKIRYICTLNE